MTLENSLRNSATYLSKAAALQALILESATILEQLGIPVLELAGRRLERMSLVFLALANIKNPSDWQCVVELSTGHFLTSREIIDYLNRAFEEAISSGSYDDIRRKDLKFLTDAQLIIPTAPDSAKNNPQRAYQLNPLHAQALRYWALPQWADALATLLKQFPSYQERYQAERFQSYQEVKISGDIILQLEAGAHNRLQKAIIEDFLARFGYGAEVLYLGDAGNKFLYIQTERLTELGFSELAQGELPDIIAYSETKNWLYIIEAVYSSGIIDTIRLKKLQGLSANCTSPIIYVTAFLDKATFRKFAADIAWETEVWIAEQPEHLIHYNGAKFLRAD